MRHQVGVRQRHATCTFVQPDCGGSLPSAQSRKAHYFRTRVRHREPTQDAKDAPRTGGEINTMNLDPNQVLDMFAKSVNVSGYAGAIPSSLLEVV